jgi:hypothetical protein
LGWRVGLSIGSCPPPIISNIFQSFRHISASRFDSVLPIQFTYLALLYPRFYENKPHPVSAWASNPKKMDTTPRRRSTSTPTPPPLPLRSSHRYSRFRPLSLVVDVPNASDLIPLPLFSGRSKRLPQLPPTVISVVVFDPTYPSHSHSSPTRSLPSPHFTRWPSSASNTSSSSSISASSTRGSLSSLTRSLSYAPSPTPSIWGSTSPPPLRRKASPKLETLRSLRAKESDACLQEIYQRQTLAYVQGVGW